MPLTNRLHKVLRAHKDHLGSQQKLLEEIKSANAGRKGKLHIDHRKLKDLVEGKKSRSLTPDDLEVLDAFLSRHGQGLAEMPIFEREGILQPLAQANKIILYLGARAIEERYYVGLYDVRASSTILQSLHRVRPASNPEIVDIVYPEQLQQMRDVPQVPEGVSICSIGAPRSSVMSEVLMADMLGLGAEKFKPPTPISTRAPFGFFWPGDIASCFALSKEYIPKKHSRLATAISKGEAYGFWYNGEIHHVDFHAAKSKDYGVLLARRHQGGVTVVIAGASGPGTLAAARLLDSDVSMVLPEGNPAQPLRVVVEATIENSRKHRDFREITDYRILEPTEPLA